jgi:hypothetical protein
MSPALDIPLRADWPLYWFARLERAVQVGDHTDAAEAQRQLARLGVSVRYGRRITQAAGKAVRDD